MKPTIRTFIKWNTRNLLITVIFFAAVTVVSAYLLRSYLMDTFLPPARLDTARAFTAENVADINDLSEVEDANRFKGYFVEEMFNAYFTRSYTQDLRRIFRILPERLYKSEKYYEALINTNTGNITISEVKTENSFKYAVAELDGVLVLIKLHGSREIDMNTVLKGVLMPLDKTFIYKIRWELGDQFKSDKVFLYELDTMMNLKEVVFPFMVLFYIPLLVTLFLLVKFIIYKIDYKKHPTYRQLRKFFGPMEENEAKINAELASDTMRYENNYEIIHNISYMTEHWAILKRAYKTKIIDISAHNLSTKTVLKKRR
jgi:hypothetical protein